MFSIFDSAAAKVNRSRMGPGRACDQCKKRKVRCDMAKPCLTCYDRALNCTYDKARKKRGPVGKRIAEIRRQQCTSVGGAQSIQHLHSPTVSQALDGPPMGSPRRRPEPLDLQQVVTASPNAAQLPDSDQITPDPAYWPPGTPPRPSSSYFVSTYSDVMSKPQQAPTSTTALSELWTPEPTVDASMASQNQSEFVFPSLPIDPHLDAFDTFCAIPQQDLPPTQEVTDVWPQCINEETLLPWIDVYFKRLHPTIPILNPTTMYREMLLRKHHSDTQYGAMLLGLCAFAMTQPLQIHERASVPSQSIKARMILEKCVRMRVTADFGEDPSIEMILTSFFLFACLFDSNRHKAAWHRLREAVDLAYSLGLHLPESYDVLEAERREQCLRTYLVLSVTER